MTGPIFDTHAHYSARAFDADRFALLDSLPGKGVVGVCEQATHSGDAHKVLELARLLTVYCGRMIVHIIPFTEIQEEIRRQCPEEYFTLIMRRFMMRLAEAVARKSHASALVTGESLGQVASQTIKALGVTEDVTKLPVLRPLIGTDKVEIIRMAREIGTYETSILPYEDCCTVFTPRHPATRPVLEDVVKAESVLDIDGLVAKALEGETWVRVKP